MLVRLNKDPARGTGGIFYLTEPSDKILPQMHRFSQIRCIISVYICASVASSLFHFMEKYLVDKA